MVSHSFGYKITQQSPNPVITNPVITIVVHRTMNGLFVLCRFCIFHENQRPFTPSETLLCLFYSMYFLKSDYTVSSLMKIFLIREKSIKDKIFLYQITFCNQRAKINLHHVYKRSMCLSH